MKNKRNIFLLFSLLVTVFSLHAMEQAGFAPSRCGMPGDTKYKQLVPKWNNILVNKRLKWRELQQGVVEKTTQRQKQRRRQTRSTTIVKSDPKKRPLHGQGVVKQRRQRRPQRGSVTTVEVDVLENVPAEIEMTDDAKGGFFFNCPCGSKIEDQSALQLSKAGDSHFAQAHGVPSFDRPRFSFVGSLVSARGSRSRHVVKVEKPVDRDPEEDESVNIEALSDDEEVVVGILAGLKKESASSSAFSTADTAEKTIKIFPEGNGHKLICSLPCCDGKTFSSNSGIGKLFHNYKRKHSQATRDGSLIRFPG